jgi:excisionase family DNA binding protein
VSGNPLMTREEVAAAFNVSDSTVKRWIRTGKLVSVTRPPHPLARCYRAQVEALLRGEPLTPEQVAELRITALRDQFRGAR